MGPAAALRQHPRVRRPLRSAPESMGTSLQQPGQAVWNSSTICRETQESGPGARLFKPRVLRLHQAKPQLQHQAETLAHGTTSHHSSQTATQDLGPRGVATRGGPARSCCLPSLLPNAYLCSVLTNRETVGGRRAPKEAGGMAREAPQWAGAPSPTGRGPLGHGAGSSQDRMPASPVPRAHRRCPQMLHVGPQLTGRLEVGRPGRAEPQHLHSQRAGGAWWQCRAPCCLSLSAALLCPSSGAQHGDTGVTHLHNRQRTSTGTRKRAMPSPPACTQGLACGDAPCRRADTRSWEGGWGVEQGEPTQHKQAQDRTAPA